MSSGSEIQSQIDLLIKSESVSVNVYQLVKSCSKVDSINQSREELEKYFIKNFKDVKGFFQVSYLTDHNQKLVSTIVDENELQDVSKNTSYKIVEVTIFAICSASKNLGTTDIKLGISNQETIDIYNIAINEKDTQKEISSNKTQTQQKSSQAETQNNIKQSQKQPTQALRRKIIDSDDDDETQAGDNKQLKIDGQLAKENELLKNLTITPKNDNKKMDVEVDNTDKLKEKDNEDEDDDDEFIAQHIKRTTAPSTNNNSGKKEDNSKPSTQGSGKNNSKQQTKTAPQVGNSKITSFFKKK